MTRESAEWMLVRHGKAGEGALRRACPFSQERHRCHSGGKRVARSLSFSQVCALSWRGKSVEGMPFRRGGTLPGKRKKARRAGRVPFHRRAAVGRRRDERPSFRARRRHIFERPAQTEPAVRALTKPANAKIVRKRRNPRGNFSFLPWLHLQPAVTCVQASLLPWLAGFPSTHSYGDFVNILNGRFKSNRPSFLCAPYPPLTLGLRLVARARPQDGPQPGKCAKPR